MNGWLAGWVGGGKTSLYHKLFAFPTACEDFVCDSVDLCPLAGQVDGLVAEDGFWIASLYLYC